MKYRQVKVRKITSNGEHTQVTYIPEMYAVVGRILQLKENDIWEDGWEVVSVHGTSEDDDSLPDYRKAIRNHRKNTGDSLPK